MSTCRTKGITSWEINRGLMKLSDNNADNIPRGIPKMNVIKKKINYSIQA